MLKRIYLNEYDFIKEEFLWKEILIFLINTKETNGLIKFLKSIDPLPFDPALPRFSLVLHTKNDDLGLFTNTG